MDMADEHTRASEEKPEQVEVMQPLLGEPFGLREVLGLVAVAAGIALINRPTPRAPSDMR